MSTEDYAAELNLECGRTRWVKNRKKIDYVLRKAQPFIRDARTACDVGIGDGYLIRCMKDMGVAVTGVDISGYLVDISGYLVEHLGETLSREGVSLIRADIADEPLGEKQYDLVTCLDVLEHVRVGGLHKAIRNLGDSLLYGGIFLGTLPLGEKLVENMVMCPLCRHKFHRNGHHHSFESMERIRGLLEPRFEVIRMGYVPPAIFRLRALNYLFFWLREFLRKMPGMSKPTTIYFIAQLVRGKQ